VGQLVVRDNRYEILNGWVHSALYNRVEELLLRNNIGEVLIFLDRSVASSMLLNIVRFCREQAISYAVVPDISILPNVEPWNRPFAGIPAIELFHTTWDSLTLISIKRLLDLLISAVALLGFLPFGLLIALAIRLEDGGPIFYVSRRIGKDGRTIRFFKFRSMVVDAEAKKRELLQFNERKDGPLFKMRDDPRITRVGRILRKLSLDEVPQLYNVLLGHMSLVGPRPHLPEEVAEYSDRDYLRLECMPGVVGLPQICGRNSLGFREWIDYDLQYRKEWTVFLDLKIICKAVSVMLSPLFASKEPIY
jgi:lipopolysaccharide/colanic/teichoic acid biosynthesis glycosyltransferase